MKRKIDLEVRSMTRPYSGGTTRVTTRYQSASNDLITSEEHPGWRNATWKQDRGGPFEVVKREYVTPRYIDYNWGDYFGPTENGFKTFGNDSLNAEFPSATSIGDAELRGLGTLAINIVAPTLPRTQLLTFLGELREGLPSLTGTSLFQGGVSATSVAEEYLNYQFGIAPTASDITSLADVWNNSQTLWDRYAANSGKLRRRRFYFQPTVESWMEDPSVIPLTPHPLLGVHSAHKEALNVVKRRIWFSGSFVYYVPTNPLQREASRLHYLFGVSAQDVPATAWEMVPYSWLVDWVANIGQILENFSAFATDGLVMPYGYICEEVIHDRIVRLTRTGTNDVFNWIRRTTRKKRIKASPFGFDVDWPNLSTKQLGILAALGVTRYQR